MRNCSGRRASVLVVQGDSVAPESWRALASGAYCAALDHTIAGVQERRRNVADAWAWLGSYDIGRDYAADLFEDLQLATVPTQIEHTAGELGALLGTMSFWARLSPEGRDAFVNENHALHERLGRPIRASMVAALVTARRQHTMKGSETDEDNDM